jgi:hypothetical protein
VIDGILKRFEKPDEVREMVKGRLGEPFRIPPDPHDSWAIGDEPYVSLHLLAAVDRHDDLEIAVSLR